MAGLSVYQVLQKLADAALAEPRGPGKKLKIKKVKMHKAYSRRHAGKTVVINNTVFAFDKEGCTAVKNTGHSQSDFDMLMRIPGMVDKTEMTKQERLAAEKAARIALAAKQKAELEAIAAIEAADLAAVQAVNDAAKAEGIEVLAGALSLPVKTDFENALKAEESRREALAELTRMAQEDGGYDAAPEETVEQTPDPVPEADGLETKPAESEEAVVPERVAKKKGRPSKKSKEIKE